MVLLLAAAISINSPVASNESTSNSPWQSSIGTALAAPPPQSTTVSISTPGVPVSGGESFIVSIEVAPGAAIAGLQYDLAFDSTLISAVNVAEGGLLSQNGASTYFSPGIINNTAGTINDVAGVITTAGQTVS
jgi:hypothetical protein